MTADIKLNGNIIEMIGEVMNHGQDCGLSVADRTKPNERWEIYAQDGLLRIWHSETGDVVRIFKSGLVEMVGKQAEVIVNGGLSWDLDAKLGAGAMVLDLFHRVQALENYNKMHP